MLKENKDGTHSLWIDIVGQDSRLRAIEILTWFCRLGYADRTLDSTISERKIPLLEVVDTLRENELLTMNYRFELVFTEFENAVLALMKWSMPLPKKTAN